MDNVSHQPFTVHDHEDDDIKWMEQGRILSGVERNNNNNDSPHQLPEWVDPNLIKEGQDFIKRHIFSVLFAHLLSLLFLLCYAPIRNVLIATGRSNSAHKSKLRYFSTLLHVKKWYEGDLLDDSSTLQDIMKVTRIHIGVLNRLNRQDKFQSTNNENLNQNNDEILIAEAIQTDLCHLFKDENNNDPTLLSDDIISQLDMAVTQFCFMGFIPLFPAEFGILLQNPKELKGLEGFLHVWALLGHFLGIHPKYNIAFPNNKNRRSLIWNQLLLPHFSSCHPSTIHLWSWLVQGLGFFIPFLTLKSLLLFITNRLLKIKLNKLWSQVNLYEWICFHLMRLCFSRWIPTWGGRILFNIMVRLDIWIFDLSLKLHIF